MGFKLSTPRGFKISSFLVRKKYQEKKNGFYKFKKVAKLSPAEMKELMEKEYLEKLARTPVGQYFIQEVYIKSIRDGKKGGARFGKHSLLLNIVFEHEEKKMKVLSS